MSTNGRNYARQTAWAVGLALMLLTPARAQSPVDQVTPRIPELQFLAPAAAPIEPLAVPNSGGGEAAIPHPTPETLPAAALPAGIPAARLGEATPAVAQLHLGLDELLESVRRSYPLLAAVLQERGIAAGEQRSSRGAYDLNVQAENMTGALGYYQTNRAALRAEQNTLPGGKVWGAYRIGRGSFEPWYLERQTNDGGEFKVGYSQSLLQGLAIDKRRTAMQKADLGVAAAEQSIDKQRIYFLKYAAIDYWKWVACGHWYLVNRDLLKLAEDRVAGIETRIQRGILPEIERLDNRRLIVTRQAKLIEAERKFQQAAVELSLYLRDESGAPVLPPADRLPSFPEPSKPDEAHFDTDVETALFLRPEPRYLRIQREKLTVELNYARNTHPNQ